MNDVKRKIPRNIIILGFVALASGFGQDMITPILPAYLTLLGIGVAGVGVSGGAIRSCASACVGLTDPLRSINPAHSRRVRAARRLKEGPRGSAG